MSDYWIMILTIKICFVSGFFAATWGLRPTIKLIEQSAYDRGWQDGYQEAKGHIEHASVQSNSTIEEIEPSFKLAAQA